MLPESLLSLILLATTTAAQNTATGTADVAAAAATAKTSSPTSFVKGKAFDRFAVIWLENTDYDKAIGDRTWILAWSYSMLAIPMLLGNPSDKQVLELPPEICIIVKANIVLFQQTFRIWPRKASPSPTIMPLRTPASPTTLQR
jgi:hypothetical protein